MTERAKFTGRDAQLLLSQFELTIMHFQTASQSLTNLQKVLNKGNAEDISKKLEYARESLEKAKGIVEDIQITTEVC